MNKQTAQIVKLQHRPSIARLECISCGASVDAGCNCGVAYKPARAAKAVAANPEKSDRLIAKELGDVSRETVRKARKVTTKLSPGKRTGKDGKSYSIKRRVVDDDLGLDQATIDGAAATVRRRVFMRCAADTIRKAEQGAGLRDAKGEEIDDEIMTTLNSIVRAWTRLRDKLQAVAGDVSAVEVQEAEAPTTPTPDPKGPRGGNLRMINCPYCGGTGRVRP
jgi:hypothetical protein